MERKIAWTEAARAELAVIRKYWTKRNRSAKYSTRLRKEADVVLRSLAKQPAICNYTKDFDVHRKLLATHFLIFYRFDDYELKVVSIWDTRRNPDDTPYSY